jgi:predicted transposase/invertase (TIGR01784 family)
MRQLKRPEFTSLEILNPFRLSEYLGGKDVVLDVFATANDHHEVQIEMQVRVYAELPERMLDNWTRLYSRQLKKGDTYEAHRPVWAVWIIDEPFGDDGEWLRLFELRDTKGERLTDHQSLVLINLPAWRAGLRKRDGGGTMDSELAEWLELLGSRDTADTAAPMEAGLFRQPYMEEVLEIMSNMTKSDRAWFLSEARRNAIWDREAMKRQGYRDGLAEGKAEGKETARLETAGKLKELGVPIETICAATELAREVVEGL